MLKKDIILDYKFIFLSVQVTELKLKELHREEREYQKCVLNLFKYIILH